MDTPLTRMLLLSWTRAATSEARVRYLVQKLVNFTKWTEKRFNLELILNLWKWESSVIFSLISPFMRKDYGALCAVRVHADPWMSVTAMLSKRLLSDSVLCSVGAPLCSLTCDRWSRFPDDIYNTLSSSSLAYMHRLCLQLGIYIPKQMSMYCNLSCCHGDLFLQNICRCLWMFPSAAASMWESGGGWILYICRAAIPPCLSSWMCFTAASILSFHIPPPPLYVGVMDKVLWLPCQTFRAPSPLGLLFFCVASGLQSWLDCIYKQNGRLDE